ncbi:hypothetical protein PCNPT3_07730 [Psychromonas sp. CNPT3]|uniref:alpha/beta hydrolase n=1 Tax=Psychromonas sp. CNPT3 TaxID=314282 RepID=UPI00006E70C9|nr:alpha/beta hydrolase [Psychromonas sp. CNPT3]AGH81484.1 hypothetical protein PCNPT3_07730 [Psychromonas sp. CNPT3]
MLFITNRAPKGSIHSDFGGEYQFDLTDNSAAHYLYYCSRTAPNKYIEIGSNALMEHLKKSKAQQILFFIHGFSNLPEIDIFAQAEKLQAYFDLKEENLIEVIALIWPCDNDFGIVKDYWDDQKAADQSAFAFARALEFFMTWRDKADPNIPCLKRINILAHSMGNRVFRGALAAWNNYDLAHGVPLLFRNTILMAPDIVNESLEEGQDGRLMSQASRNVSVYYASDDLALRASKISNLKNKVASRRLGHSGPENQHKIERNVYSIDCDNFNNQYDFPKGHSYFLSDANNEMGRVFEHFYQSIKSGRVFVDDKINRQHIL